MLFNFSVESQLSELTLRFDPGQFVRFLGKRVNGKIDSRKNITRQNGSQGVAQMEKVD
jgi:hypothetical protein